MKNFDEILSSTNWTEKIKRSLSLNGHISEMLRASDKTSGITSLADKVKNMNGVLSNTNFSAIEAAQKSLSSNYSLSQSMIGAIDKFFTPHLGVSKNAINGISDSLSKRMSIIDAINISGRFKTEVPQFVFDAIFSIGENQKKIIQSISATSQASIGFRSTLAAHSNNLAISFRKLSGHIAARAAIERKWELIEDYKDVTEKTLEFTKTLSEESEKEVNRLVRILQDYVTSMIIKYKELLKDPIALTVIFITLHQYMDFLKKPDAATKADLYLVEKKIDKLQFAHDSLIETINTLTDAFIQMKGCRLTNRNCEVKRKPRMRAIAIDKLKSGMVVTIVTTHYKWVYVSYFDSIDNLPKSGWILKKYLEKP